MQRFRSFLNAMHLEEISLVGRRFTWSSGREPSILELLDRMFASTEWFTNFPNHVLKLLSLDCSDHCPLLLQLRALNGTKHRFRFESFWTKLNVFSDIVAEAWAPKILNIDPFRVLDCKFKSVVKALRRWSNSQIGSVRLLLTMAREVIQRFDEEQETRALLHWEVQL